jgi:hypothetical protein
MFHHGGFPRRILTDTDLVHPCPSPYLNGVVFFAYQGYSLHKARNVIKNNVPRNAARVQVLSSECTHSLEVEERMNGTRINRAFPCQDVEAHTD